MNGYLGRILRVDLSRGSAVGRGAQRGLCPPYVGGSGLAARYLYDVLDADTDPLGPENPLLFLTGPLVGTSMTSAGRYSVCARSPLTGIWGEANSGGFFGPSCATPAMTASGSPAPPRHPVWLSIVDGKAELHDAGDLWGSDIYVTQDAAARMPWARRRRAWPASGWPARIRSSWRASPTTTAVSRRAPAWAR